MGTIELSMLHVIACTGELRGNPSAAMLDGQDLVVCAMRDEQAWQALPSCRGHKARGEGDDVREQVTVCKAERERIRGAIREAPDHHTCRVDGILLEGLREGTVEKGDVRAVRAQDHVPVPCGALLARGVPAECPLAPPCYPFPTVYH